MMGEIDLPLTTEQKESVLKELSRITKQVEEDWVLTSRFSMVDPESGVQSRFDIKEL